MKYLVLLAALLAVAAVFVSLGRPGLSYLIKEFKPMFWPTAAALLVVLVSLLLAHAGGYVRIL